MLSQTGKVAGARHGALQPAKRFTERMAYRSVRTLVWKSFELVSRAQCSWSGAAHVIHGWFPKQPCLSQRQGKTRIPESSEVGSNRQVDWMDKRRSNQFAVLDIQDVGNENIQEASNSCPRQIASPSRTSGRKANAKALQFTMGKAGSSWCQETT